MSPKFHPLTTVPELHRALAAWLELDSVPFALVCGIGDYALNDSSAPGHCGIIIDGDLSLVLVQTPGRPVVAASPHRVDAAIAAFAAELCLVWQAPGINAPDDWAQAIATATGQPVIDTMGLRLHRLRGEPRLPHTLKGRARRPDHRDLPLLGAWLDAFDKEIGELPRPRTDEHLCTLLDRVLLWEFDGRPVSMAGQARPFRGGWSITGVYTPPHLRGRGYAGAVVHALCGLLLAENATYVVLYTDLANPTSNGLYHRIGFAPVSDQQRLLWQRER